MPVPGEHKTVQARILAYAQEIGWTYVLREEAERRRGFDPDGATPEDRARSASLYFGDLLQKQVQAFNPKYQAAEGALIGIVHELLHFSIPHHGKLWKSLMQAHLGEYEKFDGRLKDWEIPQRP